MAPVEEPEDSFKDRVGGGGGLGGWKGVAFLFFLIFEDGFNEGNAPRELVPSAWLKDAPDDAGAASSGILGISPVILGSPRLFSF